MISSTPAPVQLQKVQSVVLPQKMLSRTSQSPCYVTSLWINVTHATSVIKVFLSSDTCDMCKYVGCGMWDILHASHVTCVICQVTCVLIDVTHVTIVPTPLCPFQHHNSRPPTCPNNSFHKSCQLSIIYQFTIVFIEIYKFVTNADLSSSSSTLAIFGTVSD